MPLLVTNEANCWVPSLTARPGRPPFRTYTFTSLITRSLALMPFASTAACAGAGIADPAAPAADRLRKPRRDTCSFIASPRAHLHSHRIRRGSGEGEEQRATPEHC